MTWKIWNSHTTERHEKGQWEVQIEINLRIESFSTTWSSSRKYLNNLEHVVVRSFYLYNIILDRKKSYEKLRISVDILI